MLLTFGSLIIGTSSIETSLGWLFSPDAQSSVVLWQIRLPRTVGAWFAGALLGLAGAIAQGVFRNPLAEPYLLGTASGAALGVTLSLIAAMRPSGGLAWAGKLGRNGRGLPRRMRRHFADHQPVTRRAADREPLARGHRGRVLAECGDFAAAAHEAGDLARDADISCSAARASSAGRRRRCSAASSASASSRPSLLSRGLDALTLGEDTAQSLGLSLPMLRLTLLGVVSLATATAVGQVGVVGFVGLVAPHLVRETLSVNHRQLLIGAPLCGGALLQAADLASRWIIRPAELPVGAVTACVGGVVLGHSCCGAGAAMDEAQPNS